jgi:ubiquinone/menaquinone biosynthesis C-methylase UbiE
MPLAGAIINSMSASIVSTPIASFPETNRRARMQEPWLAWTRATGRRFDDVSESQPWNQNPSPVARRGESGPDDPELTVMKSFDPVAGGFERYRALPENVPVAIRQALYLHGGIDATARLLEVGCGTGRFGAQFITAGDNYFGLDLSMEMLHEFRGKKFVARRNLVHADGCLLPFGDRTFRVVLMIHMLAARNWQALLAEAHRVLQRGGVLAIGKTQGPPQGVDAMMRNRLAELIAARGITEPLPDRGAAAEWLRARSSRYMEIRPAQWTVNRTPREFFLRKRSAARFVSLPAEVRETALGSLADWTEQSIGPLDTPLRETHHFGLELYWF